MSEAPTEEAHDTIAVRLPLALPSPPPVLRVAVVSASDADEVWDEYSPGGGLTVDRGLLRHMESLDVRTYVLYSCRGTQNVASDTALLAG